MKYRKDIDGLRAIAVISVLFFHTNINFFAGGFTGVDIFFVISGFLITSIIHNQLLNNQFSFIDFYERRFRRILPAFFFVVTLSFPFAYKLLLNTSFIEYAESILASTFFIANFLFWKDSDYFDTAAELKPLLHTWSLSVEEQFYIIFPILMFSLFKIIKNKNHIKYIISFFVLISFFIDPLTRYFFSEKSSLESAIFYLLPTRAWEIGIGSIIALYYKKLSSVKLNSNLTFTSGLIIIILGFIFFDKSTQWPSFYALIPTFGASLILIQGQNSSIANITLGNKIFVNIGKWSYSIYLIHLPLFVFCRYKFGEQNLNLLDYYFLITISIFLGFISYRLIETPFRNKKIVSRKKIFQFSGWYSLILASLSFFVIKSDGMPNRLINEKYKIANYQIDNKVLEKDYWKLTDSIMGVDTKGIKNRMERVDFLGNQYDWFKTNSNKKSNLLVIGNSHSYDFFGVLFYSKSFRKKFLIGRYGNQIENLKYQELKNNINYKKSDILVFCSRYSENDYKVFSGLVPNFLNDGKKVFLVKNIFEFEYNSLRNIADKVIQYEVYQNNFSPIEISKKVNEMYYDQYLKGKNTRSKLLIDIEAKTFESIKKRNPEVKIIDRMDYMISKSKANFIDIKLNKYSSDYGHHTLVGLRKYGQIIDSINYIDKFLN